VKTTRAVLDSFTTELPVSRLPQTLKDAIITTKKLGLRYLWVDCLCIVQDEPGDISKEIAMMPRIFQGAQFTILAANASHSDQGFLQTRRVAQSLTGGIFKLPFRCPDGKDGWIAMSGYEGVNPESVREPTNDRAWILQEQLISPRLLVYGSRDLSWSCFTESHEAGGEFWPNHARFRPIRKMGTFSAAQDRARDYDWSNYDWRNIVREYTQRGLSFPNDKLPAISGVAEIHKESRERDRRVPVEYLAGLWRDSLPDQLLWHREVERGSPTQYRSPRQSSKLRPPSSYRAPSWSWATLDGPIVFVDIPSKRSRPDFVPLLLECTVELASKDAPFGAIKSGQLKLKGRIKQALWIDRKKSLQDPDFPSVLRVWRCYPDASDEELDGPAASDSMPVWCLEIRRMEGLILTTDDGLLFTRVGYFMFDTVHLRPRHRDPILGMDLGRRKKDWFHNCKPRIITII
jgi:hypothetical protein